MVGSGSSSGRRSFTTTNAISGSPHSNRPPTPPTPGVSADLREKVEAGYTPGDVKTIADLLIANVDDETLSQAMVQVVNRRFFGQEIPPPITRAAKNTLQKLGQAVFPWKYKLAIQSREQIMEFCERTLEKKVHILDVGHNIGEVVQATAGAAPSEGEPRPAHRGNLYTIWPHRSGSPDRHTASKLDGLLWFTSPRQTVVILKVAKAAATSHDLYFTFGTGKPERACVFMPFFLAFMKDLQPSYSGGDFRS